MSTHARTIWLLLLTWVSSHAGVPDSTQTKAPMVRTFTSLNSPAMGRMLRDPIGAETHIVPDTVQERRKHCHALLQNVLNGQRFLESLDALSEIELPIGIVKSGGVLDYTILIDRINITKEGAIMDVYVSLALPTTTSRLAFHGRIPLSAEGGVAGNARVFLIGDHLVRFNTNTLLTLRGSDRSYVEFDCRGFLGVNIDGELQFSTDLLRPEDVDGNARDERLVVNFTTYTQSLNDILLRINLPPFQVTGLEGFGFHAADVWLDWSDLSNPAELTFPSGYTSPFLTAGLDNLWRGIYLRTVSIALPPAFRRKQGAQRVSLGAQHMLIDDMGLTGQVHADNVFQDGDMSGWSYTLERAALRLTANEVSGFAFEGKLTIPVAKSRDGSPATFTYQSQRDTNGDYLFAVGVQDDLKLDLWLADIKLSTGSRVLVREKEKRFYPSAHLNGELTINITSKGPKASFNSIRFENMVINSEAPYFQPGTFGFGREDHHSSISKYPVVFDNITLRSDQQRVGLAFDVLVNLGGKPEDGSFAGKGGLVVWGIHRDEPLRDADGRVIAIDRHNWTFEKVEFSSLRIDIRKPKVIELTGEVRFFDDDKVYGDGFKGKLRGKIQSIALEAEALFGRTETFRYWYADALVELKTGIPIVPGGLSAFGFGGGYYSRMKQAQEKVEGTLGRSPSGITYVPDEHTIGIRAIVLIGTPRPEALRGDVALEVSINRHGGVNSVTFTGNASFMSAESLGGQQIKQLASAAVAGNLTEKLSSLAKGQVFGSVRLHFDNVNDVFHGNLEIFVNVAGGIVRGVSEGNKAGWAVLHFEKSTWYVHVGTPDQPIGLEVARIFKAKSYFMLGRDLPGSPPPPSQVSEILGDVDLDYMRDLNALESGMGIAFGLHFLVDTGDLRFLMFYGRFSAGTGLDFMLKDYGNDYHCAGSSAPMGINGWYANGQAYAFVTGTIGIRVNLKFYKGKYEILSIGAAAILQTKGPNPFWMKGTVGGYYRILGGLVKGKCKFEVTVGKECTPVATENLLEDVNLIAGISPVNASVDVSVFNAPQLAFNIPVGQVFTINDMDKRTHQFRAVLKEFVIFDGSQRIDGTLQWNDEMDVVALDPHDLLPGERSLKARASLSFEEKINGTWRPVIFEGQQVNETAETTFETGKAPDFIPENNVALSYPLKKQQNFFSGEFSQGFIQLRNGQPYLFRPGNEWIQKIRLTETETGRVLESVLTYDASSRRVTFPIPDGLGNAVTYRFEIVNVPKGSSAIDANVSAIESELMAGVEGVSATMTTQSVEGNLDLPEERVIFGSAFRTSRYKTFSDKMQSISLSPVIRLSTGINIFRLTSYFRGDEAFDLSEISATPEGGLIRMEAVLDGNKWYERYVHDLLYKEYPLLGWMTVRRPDAHITGIPPARDIYVENLKDISHYGEGFTSRPLTDEYLVYNLGAPVARDYYDLQRHAVNYFADHGPDVPPRIRALVLEPLPYIRYGRYNIRFKYVIPGIEKTTSTYETDIFNRIPDED